MPDDLDELLGEIAKQPRVPHEPGAYVSSDIMHVNWEDVDYYAEWLNHRITLLRAQSDSRVIGVQIWGESEVERIA